MNGIDIAILVTWAVFWLGWIVAAMTVQAGQRRWTGGIGVRVVIILAVLLLVRAKAFKSVTTHEPWLQGIGLALFLAGLGLAVWARFYIGRNWGTPMSQKADPQLVTTGPYRYVRHPIYSGIILAMIGTTIAVGLFWLIGAVLLGGYFVYSALMEERYMAQQFPDTYPAYKRSTKMLIPFIF